MHTPSTSGARAVGHDARRSAVLVLAVSALTAAMLVLLPSVSSAVEVPDVVSANLAVHLGLHGAAAVGVWNAFMSPWAMALSLALVPLGFGTWAVTIRLTFSALVKQLGKEAARKAALRF